KARPRDAAAVVARPMVQPHPGGGHEPVGERCAVLGEQAPTALPAAPERGSHRSGGGDHAFVAAPADLEPVPADQQYLAADRACPLAAQASPIRGHGLIAVQPLRSPICRDGGEGLVIVLMAEVAP